MGADSIAVIRRGTGSRTTTTRECLLPSGRTSLWVILNRDEFCSDRPTVSGAFVVGPDDRAMVIELESGREHVDVEFVAAGAAAFFPTALSDLRGQVVDLRDVWPDGGDVRERVLGARDQVRALHDMLSAHRTDGPDPAISRAVDWIEAGSSLAEVTERLGLLPRTFRRRFLAQVGMPPKRYARIRRLQRVVGAIEECARPDWAYVAAQHGYSDQAHLIDDFRDLVGITPGQYIGRRISANHLRVDPVS